MVREVMQGGVALGVALVLALTGCGGGGGGDAAPAPTVKVRDTPLALTASNVALAAPQAFSFGGITLAFAQLAVDWTAAADAANGAPAAAACIYGGNLTVTLLDRDANNLTSAGDQLQVTLTNCYIKPLEDAFAGTLTIDIASAAPMQEQAGTITFGAQFDVADTGASTIRLGGSLRYDYSADRLARGVHAASANQPFTISVTAGSTSHTEVMTQIDATRTVRRDTARAETTMRLHLASDVLGGAIDMRTSVPWSAWFDSYPDAGELTLSGAAGQAAQMRASATGGAMFDLWFDGVSSSQVSATEAVTPYLWSGTGWYPPSGNELGYVTQPASVIGFKVMAQQPALATLEPQPGALTWSYSRPLANATFIPTSAVDPDQVGVGAQVPATVVIEGALLSVRPNTQLVPGVHYYLLFDDNWNGPIFDASGATLLRPAFSADVRQTVVARGGIAGSTLLFGPAAALRLDASASTAPGSAIVSTRWSQVSGPMLAITDADTPLATVSSLSDSGNGQAVFEVEVRNTVGDTTRARVSFPVVTDMAQTLLMVYRTGSGPKLLAITDPANGTPYVRYSASYNTIDLIAGPRLLASLPIGVAWAAGVEVAYGAGGTPGVNAVWMVPGSHCTGDPSGTVRVLDYAIDASGAVRRVAIDFEETCLGVTTAGSIRFGTSLALRP